MSSALEQKRRELDLRRVQTARFELELKVEERLEEIERLREHIKIQIAKESEIQKELETKLGE